MPTPGFRPTPGSGRRSGDVVEVSAELIEPAPAAAMPPAPPREPARVFAAPSPRPASLRLPVVVALGALAAGFAIGFLAQRASRPPPAGAAEPAGASPRAVPAKAP